MASYTIKAAGGDFSSINAFIGDGATNPGDDAEIQGTWASHDTTSVTWNKAVFITADADSKQDGKAWQVGDTTYRHREIAGHAFTVSADVDIEDINIISD